MEGHRIARESAGGGEASLPVAMTVDKADGMLRRLRKLASLVTLERVHDAPQVLVVTSGWPRPDKPAHCVFIRRQMESLGALGLRYEVLFIRGYLSAFAYPVAALRLLMLTARGRRYSLVHTHGGEASLAARFYLKAPLLVSYLGGDLLGNSYRPDSKIGLRGRFRRWIIRQAAHLATGTITKSAEMERALPRSLRARNRVIPNGVDMNVFRPMDRELARRRLGWDLSARIALFVGDPSELRKRYELAAAAVSEARKALPAVALIVADRVSPELTPVYMNAADCLVHLSWMEGSPNVVKEALMCNLPIVATAVGDIPELLNGVAPSFLVDPTLASAAEALIACLRAPRRSNGRAQSARLDSRAVAEQILTLYGQLSGELRELTAPLQACGAQMPEMFTGESEVA